MLDRFPLPIKVVLIDLDGTLLDTIADLAYAANLMRRDLGLRELPEATIKTFVGRGLQNLVARTVAVDAIEAPDSAFLEHALALYEKHYAEVLTRSPHNQQGGALHPAVARIYEAAALLRHHPFRG